MVWGELNQWWELNQKRSLNWTLQCMQTLKIPFQAKKSNKQHGQAGVENRKLNFFALVELSKQIKAKALVFFHLFCSQFFITFLDRNDHAKTEALETSKAPSVESCTKNDSQVSCVPLNQKKIKNIIEIIFFQGTLITSGLFRNWSKWAPPPPTTAARGEIIH